MTRNFAVFFIVHAIALLIAVVTGCHHTNLKNATMFYVPPNPPMMLGAEVDQIQAIQEENAEAAKFIVHEHEFDSVFFHDARNWGGYHLNEAGQDHVKQIAERLRTGAPFPVVIERSQVSAYENTEFKYPVHFNPQLDMKRREVVVRALTYMGIPDANERVSVAPNFAQPYTSGEAEAAFRRGFSSQNGLGNRGGGGGGGLGGFGLGGFGGGFGGGGFQ